MPQGRDAWTLVQGAALLLVAGLFLFSVRPILSPILLFLLLLVLAGPYRGTPLYTRLVGAAAALAFLWLLETTGFLLAPFVLALALAYILNPAVDWLARRLPRGLAILLLALPVLAALVLAAAFGVPALVDQVEALVRRAPVLAERVAQWVVGARAWLERLDLPLIREEVIVAQLEAFARRLVAGLQVRETEVVARLWEALLGVTRGVRAVLTVLGYVVLTPVLTFYLLRDYHRILERLDSLIPRPRRERWLAFLSEYNLLLGRYLRGQVTEAALVGVLTWIGLLALGFPYAGLVGAVAGVFNLVPYLGLVVSVIPAVIIALLSGDVLASLLKAAAVFAVVQLIDSTVTGPRIVGGSVGLHPIWVMLALAMGGFFFGFLGLLLAMPAALLLKLLLRDAATRYRASAAYQGAESGPAGGRDLPTPRG